jgi:hypothetical protein
MKNVHLPIALLLTVALCAGCSAGTTVAPSAQPESRHSGGKPGAAITLTSNVPTKNAVSAPIAVEIQVTPAVNADDLRLEWIPSAGLQVLAPAGPSSVSNAMKGTSQRYTVTVSAANDGVYHLGVVATLTTRGVAQTRAFSVSVAVGSAVGESKPLLNRDAKQQLIESMPARETTPPK